MSLDLPVKIYVYMSTVTIRISLEDQEEIEENYAFIDSIEMSSFAK